MGGNVWCAACRQLQPAYQIVVIVADERRIEHERLGPY